MTLVKCPNGHFYDPARFGNKCPHCGMSGQESTGDDTTIPLTGVEANQFAQESEQSNIVTVRRCVRWRVWQPGASCRLAGLR